LITVKATQTDSGKVIAVKEFEGVDKAQLTAIAAEVRLCRSVHHNNVVACLGAQWTPENSTIHIFLEFAAGGSIGHRVACGGALPPVTVKSFTAQILVALAHLHGLKIIHRDLKGANCLLTEDDTVKLADFGSAARSAVGFVTQQSAEAGVAMKGMRGTAYFMAPEVIRGEGYGRRSDVWSLGGTVVEMMTGKPPFACYDNHITVMYRIASNDEPAPIPDDLGENAKDFLLKCFERDVMQRAASRDLLVHPFVAGCARP